MRLLVLGLGALTLLLTACASATAATPSVERCLTDDGRNLQIERDILDWMHDGEPDDRLTLHLDVHGISYYQLDGSVYVHWGEYRRTFEFLETGFSPGPTAWYIPGTVDAATCVGEAILPGD